jgi:hypothetical protein
MIPITRYHFPFNDLITIEEKLGKVLMRLSVGCILSMTKSRGRREKVRKVIKKQVDNV